MFSDDGYPFSDDEMIDGSIEEVISPPEDLHLTVEVGLTQYQPNGLLEIIARALLQQIGGRDRWVNRLEKGLLDLAATRARALVDETINRIFVSELGSINWQEIVEAAAREYMEEKVTSDGKSATDSYSRREAKPRKEYLVSHIVKESMDSAFKAAETEWKENTKQAIKETLADALAIRIARTMPTPPELKG